MKHFFVLLCLMASVMMFFASCDGLSENDLAEAEEQPAVSPSESVETEPIVPGDETLELVLAHEFIVPGIHTVRGGYVSGSTVPSVSLNLSEAFDLEALAENGYKCNIGVEYKATVIGDHLNVRCILEGATDEESGYTYLDHNETSYLSCASYNIPGEAYRDNATLYIKWECEGVTILDGLNECDVSEVKVNVSFAK